MLRRTVLEAPCWTHISRGDAVLPPDPQAACAAAATEPERTVRDTAAVRRLVAVRERSAAPTGRPPRTLGLV